MKGRPVSIETKLKKGDREQLEGITRKGSTPQRQSARARALLLLSDGMTPKEVGDKVGVSRDTVLRLRSRYLSSGLMPALEGEERPGRPSAYSDAQRQRIIAVACSKPPEGVSCWTCRLLAEEVVKRGIVDSIQRESIRVILESNELKPWRKKNVVRSKTR